MSLKAINENYRAVLARALRSTVVAHINKYRRQMMAMLLAGETERKELKNTHSSGFEIVY